MPIRHTIENCSALDWERSTSIRLPYAIDVGRKWLPRYNEGYGINNINEADLQAKLGILLKSSEAAHRLITARDMLRVGLNWDQCFLGANFWQYVQYVLWLKSSLLDEQNKTILESIGQEISQGTRLESAASSPRPSSPPLPSEDAEDAARALELEALSGIADAWQN